MRLPLASLLLVLVAGCAPAYTVSKYRAASAHPARLELRAHDAFRNSDHLTLSIETRASCEQKPDLATVAELHSNRDLLLRDKSSYSASGWVEPDKPHLLRLWHVSSDGAVSTTCGNSGIWRFEPDKSYILEVRNWSSRGGTGGDTQALTHAAVAPAEHPALGVARTDQRGGQGHVSARVRGHDPVGRKNRVEVHQCTT